MLSDWVVEHDFDFVDEFERLSVAVQDEIYAAVLRLEALGPQLGKPYADTLKGSKHSDLKELRLSADGGEWRLAYAFDPKRKAILLVAGDKSGVAEARLYRTLIRKADLRFEKHLDSLKNSGSK